MGPTGSVVHPGARFHLLSLLASGQSLLHAWWRKAWAPSLARGHPEKPGLRQTHWISTARSHPAITYKVLNFLCRIGVAVFHHLEFFWVRLKSFGSFRPLLK